MPNKFSINWTLRKIDARSFASRRSRAFTAILLLSPHKFYAPLSKLYTPPSRSNACTLTGLAFGFTDGFFIAGRNDNVGVILPIGAALDLYLVGSFQVCSPLFFD